MGVVLFCIAYSPNLQLHICKDYSGEDSTPRKDYPISLLQHKVRTGHIRAARGGGMSASYGGYRIHTLLPIREALIPDAFRWSGSLRSHFPVTSKALLSVQCFSMDMLAPVSRIAVASAAVES